MAEEKKTTQKKEATPDVEQVEATAAKSKQKAAAPAKKKAPAKKAPVKKAAVEDKTAKPAEKKQAPAKKAAAKKVSDYVPNLKKHYLDNVIPAMVKRFQYDNPMEVPRLRLISINMGIGDAKNNPKALESAVAEIEAIGGQKAVVTKSRKDISNFKVRKGFPVGCKVSLRSNRMYEFLERLIAIALPRTRDFNGLSFKSFDRRGNYSFGIKEQIVFTEIDYDKIDSIRGMDITIATTAKNDDEAYWLLKEFGFPLRVKPVKSEDVEAA